MTIEIKVPVLPESVAEAKIAAWHKKPGDLVKRDENLVDIETDKVVLEVPATEDGVLEKIFMDAGASVNAKQVIGVLATDVISRPSKPQQEDQSIEQKSPMPIAANSSPSERRKAKSEKNQKSYSDYANKKEKADLRIVDFPNTGQVSSGERVEKREPMTRLRKRIAERLLASQHNSATLTTFNEVDLTEVIRLRNQHKANFEKEYGVRLGFMSFFCVAVVEALKQFPAVNASIDGEDIVYHGYFDIGVAVSSPRGLVVPVLKNADQMSMAEIEQQIKDFGLKAKEGKLSLEEMMGGTFTISNGGVFGSLMSTPILNPPQTAILGMHKIQERVMVIDGQMAIRPMMYLALSYDHRLIDGSESVRFLVAIKEILEDPARLTLGV